jgi:hypothetical protein
MFYGNPTLGEYCFDLSLKLHQYLWLYLLTCSIGELKRV